MFFGDHEQFKCTGDCGFTGLSCCDADAAARKDTPDELASSASSVVLGAAAGVTIMAQI